jgi:hypothetical protein
MLSLVDDERPKAIGKFNEHAVYRLTLPQSDR